MHAMLRSVLVLPLMIALSACAEGGTPGWTYAPATPASTEPSPGESPVAEPGQSPVTSPEPGESPAASPGGSASVTLEVVARQIAFVEESLEAPAGEPFAIHFVNEDVAVPHDVDIRTTDGTTVFDGEILTDAGEITYDVKALEAGEYTFICSVHPIPAMTGTLTVR
jgi:plastocyanin